VTPQEAWVGDWEGTRVSLLLLLSCFDIVGNLFLTCSGVLGATFFFVVTSRMASLASSHFIGGGSRGCSVGRGGFQVHMYRICLSEFFESLETLFDGPDKVCNCC